MNYPMMRKVAAVSANAETATSAGEFIAIARLLAQSKGNLPLALARAEKGYSPRVVAVFKSSVATGSMSNSAALVEYQQAIASFLDSLRNVGIFDQMLPSMRQVPFRARISVTTIGVSGDAVGEGQVKPLSQLQLAGKTIAERKAIAMVAASEELLKFSGAAGGGLFARELRSAVAMATDQQFIADLTSGISPITSNGGSAIAIRADLDAALEAISIDGGSQLFILVESATAKAWAAKATADGIAIFPQMTPTGGILSGMPVLVADGLAAGTIVVVDANQLAAAAGTIELAASSQADLQFSTAPDSPPTASTVLTSLWQSGLVALRAERYFGVERLRDTAAAVIDGVGYSGNSPA